jgi:hypothetical protein
LLEGRKLEGRNFLAVAVDVPALVDFDALECLAIGHGPNVQIAPPFHLVDGNLLLQSCSVLADFLGTSEIFNLGTNAQLVALRR